MRNSNRQLAHQKTVVVKHSLFFFEVQDQPHHGFDWNAFNISIFHPHVLRVVSLNEDDLQNCGRDDGSRLGLLLRFHSARKTWKTAQFTRFSKELCGSPYHWYWFIARAGCGVCGLSAFGAIKGHFAPPKLLWLPWVFVLFLRQEKDPKWHLVREHRRCFLACE